MKKYLLDNIIRLLLIVVSNGTCSVLEINSAYFQQCTPHQPIHLEANLYSLFFGISMCMYLFRYHYGPFWYLFGPIRCLRSYLVFIATLIQVLMGVESWINSRLNNYY